MASITGLTVDTQYQVRVRATNAAGNGPWVRATFRTATATSGVIGTAPTWRRPVLTNTAWWHAIDLNNLPTIPDGYRRHRNGYSYRYRLDSGSWTAWTSQTGVFVSVPRSGNPSSYTVEGRLRYQLVSDSSVIAYSPTISAVGPPSASEESDTRRAVILDSAPVLLDENLVEVEE